MRRIFIAAMALFSVSSWAIDPSQVQASLQSAAGLQAEVHGSDPGHNLFALVVRNPTNFFDYLILPMTGNNDAASAFLASLNRHDIINVKGDFDPYIPVAQQHILVDSATMVTQFTAGYHDIAPFVHQVVLPADLMNKTEAIVKVHGVLNNGQTLMVEYLDTNVPVIVQDPTQVQSLWRGDVIQIQYTIAAVPSTPTHIILGTDADSLQVVKHATDVNNRDPKTPLCGNLALYIESPDIVANTFAIDYDIGNGYHWTQTVFNETPGIFTLLRLKMQAKWDANAPTIVHARNYYINPKVTICATGAGNEVDPTQANPQVMVRAPKDIVFK